MGWDESDSDLEDVWNTLQTTINDASKAISEARKHQRNIDGIKLIKTSTKELVTLGNGEKKYQNIISFVLPNDLAGNRMTEERRTELKNSLLENIGVKEA